MSLRNLFSVFLVLTVFSGSGCGVKGKPLPPLPQSSTQPATDNPEAAAQQKAKKPVKIEGDFEDKKDFGGDKE
jgi:hypothetical protein